MWNLRTREWSASPSATALAVLTGSAPAALQPQHTSPRCLPRAAFPALLAGAPTALAGPVMWQTLLPSCGMANQPCSRNRPSLVVVHDSPCEGGSLRYCVVQSASTLMRDVTLQFSVFVQTLILVSG